MMEQIRGEDEIRGKNAVTDQALPCCTTADDKLLTPAFQENVSVTTTNNQSSKRTDQKCFMLHTKDKHLAVSDLVR